MNFKGMYLGLVGQFHAIYATERKLDSVAIVLKVRTRTFLDGVINEATRLDLVAFRQDESS
jgi:hypothetical protein